MRLYDHNNQMLSSGATQHWPVLFYRYPKS